MDILRVERTLTGTWRWRRYNPSKEMVAGSHASGYDDIEICQDEMFRINARPYQVEVYGQIEPWEE